MTAARIAIIQFPGSNCERETMLAVKRAGMEPVEFLWNESPAKLADFSGYIIVGGFSYEDRSRAGVIAALDPIMEVLKQQSEKAKPILGICNGAQILVETGLVPGLKNNKIGMALTDNKRIQQENILGTGFYNAWVHMRLSNEYQLNAFTRKLTPKHILSIPVAHGEGRFVIPPALLTEVQANGLNVFQYCDAQGNIIDEFPVNPNGSIDNIAAISNKVGNVMAMMPHPERTTNGDAIFQSMRDYILQGYKQQVTALYYSPRANKIKHYSVQQAAHELVIDLIITDNHAMSVESALRRRNLAIKVKRQIHWEVACDSLEVIEKIKKTGVLYNDRKEIVVATPCMQKNQQIALLVRAKEDIVGKQKLQMLKNHFAIQGIHAIRHGILWHLVADGELAKQAINTHILHNPYAHDCYYY